MKLCKLCGIHEAVSPRTVCQTCRNTQERAARIRRMDATRGLPCGTDGCLNPRAETKSQVRSVCAEHYRERMREVNREARRRSGVAERITPFPQPVGITLPDGWKWCTGCGESKPLDEFHASRGKLDGRQSRCGDCMNRHERQRRGCRPEHYREIARRSALKNRVVRTYQGFDSREHYETERDAASCAICGVTHTERPLVFDHDHVTLKDRAFLCGNCNTGLGMFQDDPASLRAAADYLERHASV